MTASDDSVQDETPPLSARFATAVDRFLARGERVHRVLDRLLDRSLDGSRVVGQVRRLPRIAASSVLGRWLTREPEPTVVVIDLRETRTVGPVLELLAWILAAAPGMASERSRIDRLGGAVRDPLERRAPAIAGGAVFGIVAGRLIGAGLPADPVTAIELVALSVAGVLCLVAERVGVAIEHSTAVSWLASILRPPDVDER